MMNPDHRNENLRRKSFAASLQPRASREQICVEPTSRWPTCPTQAFAMLDSESPPSIGAAAILAAAIALHRHPEVVAGPDR